MSNQESIIIKIKKLMDKANSTDSLEEQQSFMSKAQELLQTHNLSVHQIESVDDNKIMEFAISYDSDWERILISVISRNNFCTAMGFSHIKAVNVIGKNENASIVIYLINFYRAALLRLSITSYKTFLDDKKKELSKLGVDIDLKDLKQSHKNSFIKDYLDGGVSGISQKLSEQKRMAQIENSNLKALVLSSDDSLEKYVQKQYPDAGYKKMKQTDTKNEQAYNRGVRDGKGINANPGIGRANTSNNPSKKFIG